MVYDLYGSEISRLMANVWQYVALVRNITEGGAPRPVPNAESSGCICTRGALQNYDVVCLFLRRQ